MKASDFIVHLQQMIEEHGDLPLAILEANDYDNAYSYIEVDGIDSVICLDREDNFFNSNDEIQNIDKVFLID